MAPMAYNALKAGMVTYAKQLSQSLGPANIRVNVVCPGPIYFEGGAWENIKNAAPDLYNTALWRSSPTAAWARPRKSPTPSPSWPARPPAGSPASTSIVDGGYTKRVQL